MATKKTTTKQNTEVKEARKVNNGRKTSSDVPAVPTPEEVAKQKAYAMRDHFGRIGKAMDNLAASERRTLDLGIKIGEALADARDNLKSFKVSFKAIYEGANLKKSTAELYLKMYQNADKLTECVTISDAKSILYPNSQKANNMGKNGEDGDGDGKGKPRRKSDNKRTAFIIKEINSLDNILEHGQKIIDEVIKLMDEKKGLTAVAM